MTDAELHAHVFMDGIDYKNCVNKNKNAPDEGHIREVLSAYKEKGITFIRDGGDHYKACLKAKETAPEYGITYITPAFAVYKEGNYGKIVGRPYSNLKEYAALVKEAGNEGADFIKLMFSGILDFDCYGVISKGEYSAREMKEAVHIAHEEGFAVMAHVNGPENILNALNAGIDSLEHGYYISEEGLCALKETGCVWVPTSVTSGNLRGTGRFDEKTVERIFEEHEENIRKAFLYGARIGCGSDAGAFGVFHAEGAAEEYEILCGLMGEEGPARLKEGEDIIKEKFRRK